MTDVDELKDNLEDFVYLKYDWLSASPTVIAKAEMLCSLRLKSMTRKRDRCMLSAFNVVLTAIEVQGGYTKPIRIVTDHEVYGGVNKRSTTYTREVLSAINWLIKNDYLVKTDGRRVLAKGKRNLHLPFEYKLAEKWLSEISPAPMSGFNEIHRNPLACYVVVRKDKSKTKRSVEIPLENFTLPPEKAVIEDTTSALKDYDELMRATKLTLGDERIPPQRCSYTRIFSNAGMVDGGRLYAPILSLKSTERINLKINDEPVVEIDYKAFHPTMLYELEGLDVPENAYDFDGIPRKTAKVAFNILINRDSSKHKKSEAQSIADNTDLSLEEAESLRQALYDRHRPIKHRFNTGFGLKLQRIDSDIALEAIKHYTKRKIPIITVHDSVIVAYKHAPDVEFYLYECYGQVLSGLTGNITMSITDAESGQLERWPFIVSGGGLEVDESALCDSERRELEHIYYKYHNPED